MFKSSIVNEKSGTVIYGITPPKAKTEKEKLLTIAENRTKRINTLNCDGLIVYDIQDESNRAKERRPFEYFPTLDPLSYTIDMHGNIACEKIIYHVVGKYTRDEFIERLILANENNFHSVFVGAASKHQPTRIELSDAYKIWKSYAGNGLLGGVVIPERHHSKNDEHLRIIEKQKSGCSFFVSQCVCNLEMTKNFISDYCYAIEDENYRKSYFIFTLSICGTLETLKLMNWLGIDIPKWMKNDLSRGKDIVKESISQNIKIAEEIKKYCQEKDLCCGFNVESVSPKKIEIDAAIELFEQIKKLA
jgi:hypothetical protein